MPFTSDPGIVEWNVAELILRADRVIVVVDCRHKDGQHCSLTKREASVVRRLTQGQSREEISSSLGISIQAVARYLRRVREKRNAVNDTELVLKLALAATIDGLLTRPSTRLWSYEHEGRRELLLSIPRRHDTPLTPPEEDAVVKLMMGWSLFDIAKGRASSPRAVIIQIASVLRKLEVTSRFALASRWLSRL